MGRYERTGHIPLFSFFLCCFLYCLPFIGELKITVRDIMFNNAGTCNTVICLRRLPVYLSVCLLVLNKNFPKHALFIINVVKNKAENNWHIKKVLHVNGNVYNMHDIYETIQRHLYYRTLPRTVGRICNV